MNARALLPVLVIVLLALLFVRIPTVGAVPQGDTYDPNTLSYGLYWFGLNNVNQKFVPGEDNPYFDPSKPTIIFVHGWQPGISASYPPNFTYRYTEGIFPRQVNTANAWVQAGWNVGIFYWNQFSDEPLVTDAEAKIWTPNGPKGMRWRRGDGSYAPAPPDTPSAGELFARTYIAAMTEHPYTGGNIRIAGHSLGGQMAVRMTWLVEQAIRAGDAPAAIRPTRVALLDPYWSLGPKDYLDGQTTAAAIRKYVADLLPTGILFEWYRSSVLTLPNQGDRNEPMEHMMLYADMHPAYVADAMSRHIAARHLYFWSYAFDGPPSCAGDACLHIHTLLARLSDAQLAALMRSDVMWQQTGGLYTASPNDDVYTSQTRSHAPYQVTDLVPEQAHAEPGETVVITATVKDADHHLVTDPVLVTFSTDLGHISVRVPAQDGHAVARLVSDQPGIAHIAATVRGTGNTPDQTTTVIFSEPTPTPTPVPTATPTPTFTPSPTWTPVSGPTPTPTPTLTPTRVPEYTQWVAWIVR